MREFIIEMCERWNQRARRALYAAEREHSEWIDLGGEG
jgi:hypothetical protein